MIVVSFDIGIRNMAYCVMEKLNDDNFKILYWDLIDVSKGKKLSTLELTKNIYNEFDKIMDRYINADYILIEMQPFLAKSSKLKMISHLIYSYFVLRCIIEEKSPNIKDVKYVSAHVKLEFCKGKKYNEKMDYKDKKKRSIMYCQKLISEEDNKILNSFKKKDDLSDAFLYSFTHMFNPLPNKYLELLKVNP
jgi:hypothetical protein